MPSQINRPELAAVFGLAALGGLVVIEGGSYPLGSLTRPGPGFVPVVLGALIILLALAVAFDVRRSDTPRPDFGWRPLLAVTTGILAFAVLVTPLGFIPATIALVMLSGCGETRPRLLQLAGVAIFMGLFGYLMFIKGLGVPLDAVTGYR